MKVFLTIAFCAGSLIAVQGNPAWGQMPTCGIPPCGASAAQTGQSGSSGRSGVSPSAQQQQQQQQSPLSPGISEPDGPLGTQLERDQAKMRNTDRQKQLVADTERLLNLANELKADVDKSNKDTLSLDVVKKADEIEKLAHNVKEKMKGS
jgi:hypothetical protein